MPDRFTEITVETKEQSYILTELHETHARAARLLQKLENSIGVALERGQFDDVFLLNPCREVPEVVAELRALLQAARLSGCSRDEIASASTGANLIVGVRE